MKKLFLSISILLGVITFAQKAGLKGGVNFANISSSNDVTTKGKIGFYGGLFVNAPITENFSIQPEFLYNSIGTEYENKFNKRTLTLNYLSVPLMFKYNVVPAFYMEVGPEFGFLLSANSKMESKLINSYSETELNKDNFNAFNFSVGIGAGFNLIENFGISARYIAGMTDATDPNNQEFGKDAKNKNNVLQFGVNFKF